MLYMRLSSIVIGHCGYGAILLRMDPFSKVVFHLRLTLSLYVIDPRRRERASLIRSCFVTE